MHVQRADWLVWIGMVGLLAMGATISRMRKRSPSTSTGMHPQQKMAWFTVIVIAVTLALYAAAVPAMSWWFHRSWEEAAVPAFGLFGLVGVTGFARAYYRAPKGGPLGKEPAMDERDWLLTTNSWRVGMAVAYFVFFLETWGTWAWLYYVRGVSEVTMPITMLGLVIPLSAFVAFLLGQALATLHYYGWRASDASSQ